MSPDPQGDPDHRAGSGACSPTTSPGKQQLVHELLSCYLDGVTELANVIGSPDERLAAIIDGVLLAVHRSLPQQRMALSLMTHPSTNPVFAQLECQ